MIDSIDIIISLKIRFFKLTIQRFIYFKKITIISSHVELIVVVHHIELTITRNFLFESNDNFNLIMYAHLVDAFIKFIIVRNDKEFSIMIFRNFRLNKIFEIDFSSDFHIDIDDENVKYFVVKEFKFIHKNNWFKKFIFVCVVIYVVVVIVDISFSITFVISSFVIILSQTSMFIVANIFIDYQYAHLSFRYAHFSLRYAHSSFQKTHFSFRYAHSSVLTLRLYQSFCTWCWDIREICDRLSDFSHICRVCSDTIELNNDLHRHQRIIHFNQTSRRHRKNVQSISQSYHASKSWILFVLIFKSHTKDRQTTNRKKQITYKLVWDTRDNFLENAYFTLNQNFISAFISNNSMKYWNDWISSTKSFVLYDEIEFSSKMKNESRIIFENDFENFSKQRKYAYRNEKCAFRNEKCAYRNEKCAYQKEKCAYW